MRCYDAPGSDLAPVLCLAGLTRNGRDFHDLARGLSTGPWRRSVYALDARGRGLSEFDSNWKNYSVPVEMQDVIDVAAALGLHGVHVVGTSRGGLIAMVLAAVQPSILGTLVLNDIGPVIEYEGLSRIAGYVGRLPLPGTWQEACELVADLGRRSFPSQTPEVWEQVARAWFNEKDGRPTRGYDPKLGKTISFNDGPVPQLWPQFDALRRTPLLVIRGELSDILSAETLGEMQNRHPYCAVTVVPGQGHAPLLKDATTISTIGRFMLAAEGGGAVAGRDFATERD